MNLQSKHQKSNVQAFSKEAKNTLIIKESNARILNSPIEKQHETTNISQDKSNLAPNSANILNSKDLEIFNNIANKITNNNSTLNSTQKKKKNLNKNASCENIKSLIDNKTKEMEIYNKINNFSLKYSNGQQHNTNLNGSGRLSQRSYRNKSQVDSVNNKSYNSKNATPNKKQNLFTNLNNNNNNNLNSNSNSVCNYNNNNNVNNMNNTSNASFNNSLLLHGLNNNNENLNKFNNNSHNFAANAALSQLNHLTDKSSLKPKQGHESVHPHKISKIRPISADDFENCVVSDEDDHLPQAPLGAAEQQLNRSIVLKPKPPLELNNYLSRELANKAVIEEESGPENNTIIESEFKPAAYAPVSKTAFYDSKKILSSCNFDVENNAFEANNNNNNNNNYVNAEKNNKELLKALTHMEQEINKSEFNNAIHSKSHISNNGKLTINKTRFFKFVYIKVSSVK